MVFGVSKLASKSIVSAPAVEFAWPTAQRRVPALPSSSVLVTVKVDSNCRSSSASKVGRSRRRCRSRASTVPRPILR